MALKHTLVSTVSDSVTINYWRIATVEVHPRNKVAVATLVGFPSKADSDAGMLSMGMYKLAIEGVLYDEHFPNGADPDRATLYKVVMAQAVLSDKAVADHAAQAAADEAAYRAAKIAWDAFVKQRADTTDQVLALNPYATIPPAPPEPKRSDFNLAGDAPEPHFFISATEA